jgi:hypothetical protein
LAATLYNLGRILGADPESRSLWEEAETVYAELAASAPERFGPDLARVRDSLTRTGT